MDDLISRQAAIDAIGEKNDEIFKTKQKGATYPHDDFFQGMAYAENVVKQLPSAQPKKGRWISADAMFHGVPFYCSECGENTRDTVMGKPRWKFCPMCGAKMGVTE